MKMKINWNKEWNIFYNGKFWDKADLPLDLMIRSPRNKDSSAGGSNAYFEGAVYAFEKELVVPAEWLTKRVYLRFDGVYRNAEVFVNGESLCHHAYGYTGFDVCLDGHIHEGNNLIRVVADNSKTPNSRWYTGGGIYRDVTLIIQEPVCFELDSVRVETMSINPPKIHVKSAYSCGEAFYEIYDGAKLIATSSSPDIDLPEAKLWSDKSPYLYTLKAKLLQNGKLMDEEVVRFGIRELRFSTKGFYVNGVNTLLRGGCIHHDNGIVGSAAYKESEYRKIKKLKEAGFNAIRSAHNPCSRHLLNACDEYGVYVLDEGFDMWYNRKRRYDYALDFMENYESDLAWMVAKDYNHPSVIMYSIGNEISEPGSQKGLDLAKKMVDLLHRLDATRPVTAGANLFIIEDATHGLGIYDDSKMNEKEKPVSSDLFNQIAQKVGPKMNDRSKGKTTDLAVSPFINILDIAGYNYANKKYVYDGLHHPERIIFGSETFPQDIYKNWQMVKEFPYLFGDFMWVAWDYLGEVGLGGWTYEEDQAFIYEKPYPWILADSGAIDIIGTPNAELAWARTVWGLNSKPVICLMPVNKPYDKVNKSVWRGTNAIESYAWRGCDGKMCQAEIYTEAVYVTLYINDKKLTTHKVKQDRAIFHFPYASGTIKAVALDAEKKPIGESSLHSSFGPLHVHLRPEAKQAHVGEVVYIDVTLEDEHGIVESNADTKLEVSTKAELLAFGSAEQQQTEPYYTYRCTTYYGRALLVIRPKEKGYLQIKVEGEGVASSEIYFDVTE